MAGFPRSGWTLAGVGPLPKTAVGENAVAARGLGDDQRLAKRISKTAQAFRSDGYKLPRDELKIEAFMDEGWRRVWPVPAKGRVVRWTIAGALHRNRQANSPRPCRERPRIVIDCANGE